ncbi:MAG: adenylyl-sulfate kinase [Dehalococcoidia bacterium]|nr:adenylyl-sulfate kinase [Dehalococcoidia bacterium]
MAEPWTTTGATVWFTGLSGAGKTTISEILARNLREHDVRVEILDGDVVRENLSKGLGFSKEDRDINIRRIGFVCDLLSRNGVIAIAAAISPYREVRDEVRSNTTNFLEVYARCPIDVLSDRDVKGLYKKALAGEIKNFTGVSDPYEEPLNSELVVDTDRGTPEEYADRIVDALEEKGYLSRRPAPAAARHDEVPA